MTKKDFELIAAALLRAKPPGAPGLEREYAQHATDCLNLASALATTNPKFDRARFLAACGVQS